MKMMQCSGCGATLFVSSERAPRCGACGEDLATARSLKSKPGLLQRLRLMFRRDERAPPDVPPPDLPDSNIKAKLDRLAKSSWGDRTDIEASVLTLDPRALQSAASHAEMVSILLKHVRAVAPGISVPMMTPRVVVERLTEAAGQFSEQDGWVKISVGTHFFDDERAARAILCHELCHYVLNANGIREQPTLENERLTDAAMFVFGLGEVFKAGFKGLSKTDYRAGHRLGYLSDAEYDFALRYTAWLRRSETFLNKARRRDDWSWDRSLR